MYYISLGPDCHIAGALNFMNLRLQALPFDFLLSPSNKGLEYVCSLIENNFSDFLNKLEYNNQNKVLSKNYPDTLFYHHDLIKNKQKLVKSLKIDHINMNEPLITKFRRRGDRFMNIISNENKCMFFYILPINDIIIESNFINIMTSIDKFIKIMNKQSKCQYILIIFVKVDKINVLKISDKILLINEKYKQVKLEPFFGKNINEDNTFNITICIDKYPI